MIKRFFLPLWVGASVLLFLYSFTQVDLSLTFSKAPFLQSILKAFQYIGWFDRPLSTYLYVAVFAILFLLYFATIRLVSKDLLSRKTIWTAIILVTVVLAFSYNALSYDLFNYIFDAKIITFYNQNPYIHKALDYPGDPMLSFMRWTHRTYPYGPGWLALTVPLSLIGGNIFIVTYYLFKLLMAAFFILSIFSIEKIARILKFKNALLPFAVFAFNPFVLSESLVSAHNDIVMMGLLLFCLYYLLDKKNIKGSLLYFFSISIKFATALWILAYFLLLGGKFRNKIITFSIIFMIIAVILASFRTTFQPWYLLYVLPFAALMYEKNFVKFPLWVFSIFAVVFYIPFLYSGNWDPPIPSILNSMLIVSTILSFLLSLGSYLRNKGHE